MKPHYNSVLEMLYVINEPNRSKCIKILNDNEDLFKQSPGSMSKHQAWPGGYLDHVQETMNICIVLYNSFSELRPLRFSLSDALLVLFIHDLEKPWKYGKENFHIETKEDRKKFRELKIKEYGVELTSEIKVALKYTEGENEDYSPTERKMNELGALCHMADTASARLWFNEPQKRNSW